MRTVSVEIESTKHSPENQGSDGFTKFEKLTPIFIEFFQKREEKGTFPRHSTKQHHPDNKTTQRIHK